jgi:hypothetical protein
MDAMKKIFFLIILVFSIIQLFSAELSDLSPGVDFSGGFRAVYSDTGIIFTESDEKNSLIAMITALEVDVEISDYLIVGIIAGYNWNHFLNSLPVISLPLSLEVNGITSNSMIFGINLKSEFFSSGDFSLFAKAEFIYFKRFSQESEIPLSIVTGTSVTKNSFYQGGLDLVLKYHGFRDFDLYLGPQLNLLDGNFFVSETIEDISEEVELKYRQKNIVGALGGMAIEFGLNWEAYLEISFFSRFSIGAGIFYAF